MSEEANSAADTGERVPPGLGRMTSGSHEGRDPLADGNSPAHMTHSAPPRIRNLWSSPRISVGWWILGGLASIGLWIAIIALVRG